MSKSLIFEKIIKLEQEYETCVCFNRKEKIINEIEKLDKLSQEN
jgi:hypothetical protein